MSEELKPCPFCGSKECSPNWHNHQTWVECDTCRAKGRHVSSPWVRENRADSEMEAAYHWNTRAELAALKAVEVMRFQLKHPFSGESRIVEVNRADVIEGMEDALFEKLGDLICQCESVGETNVVGCSCDDYIYEFDLVSDVVTAQPAYADARLVPVDMPERWEDRLTRMHPTIQAGCWPKRWVDDAKDYELDQLRALLARSESKRVKL